MMKRKWRKRALELLALALLLLLAASMMPQPPIGGCLGMASLAAGVGAGCFCAATGVVLTAARESSSGRAVEGYAAVSTAESF